MKIDYGNCVHCGGELEPVWFKEEEYSLSSGFPFKTGRTRSNVDYLICVRCMRKEIVDDSFATSWKE